jgi:L-ribulokinase
VIDNPTCVGAAIRDAVAAGAFKSFAEGADRFGARHFEVFKPDLTREAAYQRLYRKHRGLSASADVRNSVRARF